MLEVNQCRDEMQENKVAYTWGTIWEGKGRDKEGRGKEREKDRESMSIRWGGEIIQSN